MIKRNPLIVLIISVVFVSCYNSYIGTRSICENTLFVEFYKINPSGNATCYLTDSLNFKISLGKFDPDAGNYKFECKGDSLYVQKFKHRNQFMLDTVNIVTSKTALSLSLLKHDHTFK
jgi:hypothetical protein